MTTGDDMELGEQRIQWGLTRAVLESVPTRDLHKLAKLINKEKKLRWDTREALKRRYVLGMNQMSTFMAGVTWALACRNSLRASKGHTPAGGKRPQSGEMWLPRELLYAARHEVKERGWSPLTAACWSDVQSHLRVEAQRKPLRKAEELELVKFHVRMAPPTYAAVHIQEDAIREAKF